MLTQQLLHVGDNSFCAVYMLGLVLRLKEMVSRVRARPPAAPHARDAGAQGRFATPGLVPNRLNQSQALPASVANQCSFNTKDSSILVLTYTSQRALKTASRDLEGVPFFEFRKIKKCFFPLPRRVGFKKKITDLTKTATCRSWTNGHTLENASLCEITSLYMQLKGEK